MDSDFHYDVVPSGANMSSRVSFQPELTQAELVTAVAAATGLTEDQVTAVGTSILTQLILAGKVSRRSLRLFNLFNFTPRCGGTHSDPDFQPTAANMNLAINCTLTRVGLAMMEDGITFQRDAVRGTKVPVIDRVYDGTTRALNRCTPGGAFRIYGRDNGPEPDATSLYGVFLAPVTGGGAAVRVASYSDWTDGEIMGSWPSGITGPQLLSIVTAYTTGGSIRTGMFGTHLNP
jgi:hypothetical protein